MQMRRGRRGRGGGARERGRRGEGRGGGEEGGGEEMKVKGKDRRTVRCDEVGGRQKRAIGSMASPIQKYVYVCIVSTNPHINLTTHAVQ